MKFFLFLIVCITSISSQEKTILKIAAAGNTSYVFPILENKFEKKNPNVDLQIFLKSSGKLYAQIVHHGDFDLFLSANLSYANKLYKNGFSLKKEIIYAQGKLILMTRNPLLPIDKKGKCLLNAKSIAVADFRLAPYGKAAKETMKSLNIFKKVEKNLIYGKSINQTLQMSLVGADYGFVSYSSLFSEAMKDVYKNKQWVEIDSSLYSPILQGGIVLKHSKNKKLANKFLDFLLKKEGKEIMKSFGYNMSFMGK